MLLISVPGVQHMYYYNRVITIVVESGAIYTSALICELVVYVANNSGFFIVMRVISQVVVGISSYSTSLLL